MQTWLNLQDKIIIVTGGASGIGLAIVEELLAQGANVQMVDIHGGDGQYESHIRLSVLADRYFQRQRDKSYGSRNYPAFWSHRRSG